MIHSANAIISSSNMMIPVLPGDDSHNTFEQSPTCYPDPHHRFVYSSKGTDLELFAAKRNVKTYLLETIYLRIYNYKKWKPVATLVLLGLPSLRL